MGRAGTAMGSKSGSIQRYAKDTVVALSEDKNQHEICDMVQVLHGQNGVRSLVLFFHDYAGTLLHTVSNDILAHVHHVALETSGSEVVGFMLEGQDDIATGLKALFTQKAQGFDGSEKPLFSAQMQQEVTKECDFLDAVSSDADIPEHDWI
tara:strand:+ start:786 stop:1238 length:453 start_codon:yes stop_codon:yes gene_type:complete